MNPNMSYNQGIVTLEAFTGMHCYVVNRRGAERVLELISAPTACIDHEVSYQVCVCACVCDACCLEAT